jgi:hypothetical protein
MFNTIKTICLVWMVLIDVWMTITTVLLLMSCHVVPIQWEDWYMFLIYNSGEISYPKSIQVENLLILHVVQFYWVFLNKICIYKPYTPYTIFNVRYIWYCLVQLLLNKLLKWLTQHRLRQLRPFNRCCNKISKIQIICFPMTKIMHIHK